MRIACIDLPAFPLQLLLKMRPEFRGHPVVVVDVDSPSGKVLWVNEAARRTHVLPGMRYASALSLTNELRAGVVDSKDIQKALKRVYQRVLSFSPEVECGLDSTTPGSKTKRSARWENAFEQEPGVFWADTTGLNMLFPDWCAWSKQLRNRILELGYFATVVTGFTRFGTYAVAKSRPGFGVFKSRENELRCAQRVRLDRLGLSARDRDFLAKLSVYTVGELCALPPGGLRRRFADEVHRLYRMGQGELEAPLRTTHTLAPAECTVTFDFAVTSTTRLLFFIKRHLHPLLKTLAERSCALSLLRLEFETDPAFRVSSQDESSNDRRSSNLEREEICPAEATLDESRLMGLLRLRLESKKRAPILSFRMFARGVRASSDQLRLFEELIPGASPESPTRDLKAADRALERVRAQFGVESVVHAQVCEGHLPETQMCFVPLAKVRLPKVSPRDQERPIHSVRRVYDRPQEMGPPRGVSVEGPFWISGAWWAREIRRAYHYVQDGPGRYEWMYFDERRGRWFLQGVVE